MLNHEPNPLDRDQALRNFRKRMALGVLIFLFVVVPFLSWYGIVDDTNVNKLGRYLCFAIVALGIDLLVGLYGLARPLSGLLFLSRRLRNGNAFELAPRRRQCPSGISQHSAVLFL